KPPARLLRSTGETPQRHIESRIKPAVARERLFRLDEIARDLFGMHHQGAFFGEGCFFPRLWCEFIELCDNMGEIVLLGLCACEHRFMFRQRLPRCGCRVPELAELLQLALKAAKSIKNGAVAGGVQQAALIMLAMHLDKLIADL